MQRQKEWKGKEKSESRLDSLDMWKGVRRDRKPLFLLVEEPDNFDKG